MTREVCLANGTSMEGRPPWKRSPINKWPAMFPSELAKGAILNAKV
jgi:hypothetical protein